MSNPTFCKSGILKEIKVIREFIAQCPAAKCSALRLLAKGGWLLLLLSAPLLASCIRDQLDDCPPLRVEIGVKDKNYFNVDKVDMEEQRSDSLAFRQYVPTLFYMLRDAATGDVVEEQGVFPVEGDGKTVPVDFCPCLPHGRYILTVWGGLDDLSAQSRPSLAGVAPRQAAGWRCLSRERHVALRCLQLRLPGGAGAHQGQADCAG